MATSPVPIGAAILLDLIGRAETARNVPESYGVILGHQQGRLNKPLTEFSIDELLAAQVVWAKNGWTVKGKRIRGSAAGRYQIIRKTLLGLIAESGVKGSAKFTPDLQDSFALRLLKRRGYLDFVTGKIGITHFALNLAKEWASFPVLANVSGAHRMLVRGQSYYAGDGVNGAQITPERVEEVLRAVLSAQEPATTPQEPVPGTPAAQPQPSPQPSPRVGWLAALIAFLLSLFSKGARK